MSEQAFFPLCVSAVKGGDNTVTVILSGTDNLGSYANYIRIDADVTLAKSETLVELVGWTNGFHPYNNLGTVGKARVGVMGLCPLELRIPSNFSVSSIKLEDISVQIPEWYITYGCVRDVNQRAANTTAGNQKL